VGDALGDESDAAQPAARMPITHLTEQEAADVAEWLLSQEPQELGSDWSKLAVAKPDYKTLRTSRMSTSCASLAARNG